MMVHPETEPDVNAPENPGEMVVVQLDQSTRTLGPVDPLDRRDQLLALSGVSKLKATLDMVYEDLTYEVEVPDLEARKRHIFAKKPMKRKRILDGCSGMFRSGRVTAIMGASGAGKTTMLRVLSGDIDGGFMRGQVRVNGQEIFDKQIKALSGFVFQDDVILPTMTVREALEMSARLRLPPSVPAEERAQRVDGLLRLLNLVKCQHTVVGDSMIKGISGGERKRCAIAMEMVTNPALLFLDEPTTGLDTFTAHSVVTTLRRLARAGRAIVATVHQPSSDLFALFDDLVLLANGRVVFHGPVSASVGYFDGLGFPCPMYTNAADFIFLAVLSNETRKVDNPYSALTASHGSNQERIRRIVDYWSESPTGAASVKGLIASDERHDGIAPEAMRRRGATLWGQFQYLAWRSLRNMGRNPAVLRANAMQAIFLGLMLGLLYLQNYTQPGPQQIQNTLGALFFMAIFNAFNPAFSVMNIFTAEKVVFHREFSAGYYKLLPFFSSKVLTELPMFIVLPIVSTSIIYWMMRFPPSAVLFFRAVFVTILTSCSGFAMGIFFASVLPNIQIALIVAPIVLITLMLLSGFYVTPGSIPVYLRWLQYLSPMKYAFEALAKTIFPNMTFNPPSADSTVPMPASGDQEIEILGLNDVLSYGVCCAILIAFVIILFLLAYAGMHWYAVSSHKRVVHEDRRSSQSRAARMLTSCYSVEDEPQAKAVPEMAMVSSDKPGSAGSAGAVRRKS